MRQMTYVIWKTISPQNIYLRPAHKSGGAPWVRIASSVQTSAGGALIGIKCAVIRIGSRRCGSSQRTTIHACTPEAMRTQASPDLRSEFKWLIALNFNLHSLHLLTR